MGRYCVKAYLSAAFAVSACLAATGVASANPPNVVIAPAGPLTTFTPDGPNPATIPLNQAQCPEYRLCLWSATPYAGVIWTAGGSNGTWQATGSFNDQASSLWNRRTNSSWVNKDYPGGADYACTGGGGGWYYPYLSRVNWPQDGSSANKSISSFWIPNNTYNNCSGQPQFK
jgi:hypothetical protein